MIQKGKDVAHDNEDGSRPILDDTPDFEDKLVFGFKLWKARLPYENWNNERDLIAQ